MPTYPVRIYDEDGPGGPQFRPLAGGGAGPPGVAGAAGVGLPVGGNTGQYLRKAGSADYVTEWATPPSGGTGAASMHSQLVFQLDAGTILTDAYYPDYSVPGLGNSERVMMMSLTSPYNIGYFRKMHGVLTNVQSAPGSAVTFTLYNLTKVKTVFSLSFSGTPNATYRTLTSSDDTPNSSNAEVFDDGDFVQLRCTGVPTAGNAYGVFIVVTFELVSS